MTITSLANSNAGPSTSTSRHTSPINGPLNIDGPVPPRLRGSPFLAAVSSPSSSASSSSSSVTTLASLNNQQQNQSSPSPYSHTSSAHNISDSALPQSLASTSGVTSGSWLDQTNAEIVSRPPGMVSPHKLQQQQQRARMAHTRAASLSASSSNTLSSLMTALSSSPSSSSVSSSSSTSTVGKRPGTPRPSPTSTVSTPALSQSFPRAKSPLASIPHISIPPPPTIVPDFVTPFTALTAGSASTPYPYPYPTSAAKFTFESALDDSSDDNHTTDDDDDDDEDEEYFEFDSSSSAYVTASSSLSSSSSSSSSSTSSSDEHLDKSFKTTTVLQQDENESQAMLGKLLRPRGQSTPSLGKTANMQIQLDTYFAAALTLGGAGSGSVASVGSMGAAKAATQ